MSAIRPGPAVVATTLAGTAVNDVVVVGTTAVALAGNDVFAIEISDPSHPREQSHLSYNGLWFGYVLFVEGTTVYAAGGPIGAVRIFDLSSPAFMKMTGLVDLPTTDYYLALNEGGGYLYAGNKWGLQVLSLYPDTLKPTFTRPPQRNPDKNDLAITTGQSTLSTKENPINSLFASMSIYVE